MLLFSAFSFIFPLSLVLLFSIAVSLLSLESKIIKNDTEVVVGYYNMSAVHKYIRTHCQFHMTLFFVCEISRLTIDQAGAAAIYYH